MNKQTIFITGASKGIGLAIATSLHNAGHHVIGTSRKPKSGSTPFPLIALDVTDDSSVKTAMAQVLDKFGRIDILINNAGYDLYGAAEETTLAETIAQMDTNFYGTVRMIQAILPHMRERRSGKIINIGSIGGYLGLPFNSAYAASKYALEGYSESLRLEMLSFNIYISLVEPEAVATDTLDTSIVSVKTGHPAYQAQRQAMVNNLLEMGRNSPVTPEQVARTVEKIVSAKVPKLRYPVGRQAQGIPWLKTLLPQNLFERFMRHQFSV